MHGSAKPEPGDKAETGRTAWHQQAWWLALALSVLASLPVMVAWAPQMTDYPSHLAGYKVMLDHGADPFLTRYFKFKWEWTGNLGVELLMVPFTPLFGLERAGRFIVLMIPLLTGLGIMVVTRALRRPVGIGTILAFSAIWSPSLLMGFLNYSLSLALGLFAFALWVSLENKPWRCFVFIPIGFAVWLCHVSGWGVLGVMVFGYEWHRRKDWTAFLAPWPLIFPALPMLVGMGANAKVGYGRLVIEYKWSIFYKAMRSHVEWFDIASVSIISLILLAAAVFRRIDGRLGWAALLLFGLTLVVPRNIFGGDYADYRLSTTALLVACMAIDWRVPRWGLTLAAALVVARIGVVTAHWYHDGQVSQQMIEALKRVPQGAKVATAVAIPRSQWKFGPFEHFGSYAVVRRSTMENSNFALPDVHMLSMRDGSFRFNDPTHRILYSANQDIDLRRFRPARHADFLWYMGDVKPVALPDGARIVFSTPNSFLARLAKPVGAR